MRIINLPICYRTEKIARKIGHGIGEFLEQDNKKNYAQLGNSIRIRVKMDITKPLRRGFMINLKDSRELCWVTIRYERIPDFCFNCGVIGHVVKDCLSKRNEENDNKEEYEFGMWMKFQGYTGKTKNQGSPRRDDSDTNDQDLNGRFISENKGSGKDGLDVDLNLISPIAEDTEETERVEEENAGNMNEEDNRHIDEEGSSWNILQMIEKESSLDNMNDNPIEMGDNQIGEGTSSQKIKRWKRRERIEQTANEIKDSSGSRKRKGIGIEGKQKKKSKGIEAEGVDMVDASHNLAVAVEQPCQGL